MSTKPGVQHDVSPYSVMHTGWLERMSHRKWRETKQQLIWWPEVALLECCLVSLHFLCDILSSHPVETYLKITSLWFNKPIIHVLSFNAKQEYHDWAHTLGFAMSPQLPCLEAPHGSKTPSYTNTKWWVWEILYHSHNSAHFSYDQ